MSSKASLAQPAHEPTTREERGQRLYAEHAEEIRYDVGLGVWLVPSQHDATSVYEVTLGLRPGCECKDHQYTGRRDGSACKHIRAARLAEAERTDPELRIDYPAEEELLAAVEYALDWFCLWEEHANHENDFGGEHAVMRKLGRAMRLAREEG